MIKIKKVSYILLSILICIFLISMSIRMEFKNNLKLKYPSKTFSVDFLVIFDPIYMKFSTHATCLEDYTEFSIHKFINSKVIRENYLDQKNSNLYNALLQSIFEENDIKKYIKDVTGGGKMPLDENKRYEQINFHLKEEANHCQVIKDSLILLKNNNISCNNIIYEYEKDKGIYKFNVDLGNYDISVDEINEQIVKIK